MSSKWIAHDGGPCPVPKGTLIDVVDVDNFAWRGVEALDEINTAAMWEHRNWSTGGNIAYYQIVEDSA